MIVPKVNITGVTVYLMARTLASIVLSVQLPSLSDPENCIFEKIHFVLACFRYDHGRVENTTLKYIKVNFNANLCKFCCIKKMNIFLNP